MVPDEAHQGDTLTDSSSQDAADASGVSTAFGVIGALVIILFAAIIFVRRRAKYTLLGDGNLLSEEYNHYEGGDGDSIYNNPAYLNTHEMDGSSEEDEEDLVWKTGKKGRFQA